MLPRVKRRVRNWHRRARARPTSAGALHIPLAEWSLREDRCGERGGGDPTGLHVGSHSRGGTRAPARLQRRQRDRIRRSRRRGLTALERIAEIVERRFSFPIHVYGFDTGRGLPKPVDTRDLPQLYSPDTYVMDETRLRSILRRATSDPRASRGNATYVHRRFAGTDWICVVRPRLLLLDDGCIPALQWSQLHVAAADSLLHGRHHGNLLRRLQWRAACHLGFQCPA